MRAAILAAAARVVAGAVAAAVLGLAAAPAAAQEGVAGPWVIRRAPAPAPWVAPGTTLPADGYARRLPGQRVTFAADRIRGPAPLACRGPHYQTRFYPADMLFQGNLTQAEAQASALGFVDRPIRTLETGCAGAIDFHLVDADTMLFALDNRIYTLDRVRPSPRR